jgi:hypothetical protein
MNLCSPRNPNICLDCEALTLDDSPSTLPGQTKVEGALAGSGVYGSNKRRFAQHVAADNYADGDTNSGCTS